MRKEQNMVKNVNSITSDYLQFLNNKQLSKKYRDCIRELTNNIIASNLKNIETILLFGGIVRDSKAFKEWSDIDIVVIFKDITKRSAADLAKILQQLESRYSIRIDLIQISLKELTDERLAGFFLNSGIINALSTRENVSILVFGHVPSVSFTTEQEKQAAILYIVNTLALFREYLIEVLYRNNLEEHIKTDFKRIIRWVFSIIRASLRLFDIYTHPYEYSLPFVRQIFPEVDTSLLLKLIRIRKNINIVDNASKLVQEIEIFIEEYVVLSLRRYMDEIKKNK